MLTRCPSLCATQAFLNAEDENFTLFNNVNDLTQESEKLEEAIAQLRSQSKQYQKGESESVLLCSFCVPRAAHGVASRL